MKLPGALHRCSTIEDLIFASGAALADDDLREMREGSEIARCADRTLRRNQRMNFGVEHFAERVDNLRADAAEAFGERVGAEQHHGASFGSLSGVADSTSVRANEIDLELADLFGGDADGSEFAEAGVDAVGGGAAATSLFDNGAGSFHAFDGVG